MCCTCLMRSKRSSLTKLDSCSITSAAVAERPSPNLKPSSNGNLHGVVNADRMKGREHVEHATPFVRAFSANSSASEALRLPSPTLMIEESLFAD